MRHSRKAVMAERYKLYMKKNIFNGRYLVRNIQIFVCAVLVIGLVAGAVILVSSDKGEDILTASASAGVKEALFGNSEEEKKVTKKRDTEEIVTTEITEVAIAEITEAVSEESTSSDIAVADKEEDTVQLAEQEEKSEFEGKCIANVDETLNIRKEPSAEAEFVGSMNRGAIARVEGTEGEWTKIKSGDVEGYVLSEYILTGEAAEEFAKDYVTLQGTVLEDGVNVRTKESTDSEILTVLDKDATITVLENPEESSNEENESETEDSVQTENVVEAETSETATETTETSTQAQTSENSTEVETSTETEISTEEKTSETVIEQTTTGQEEEQETVVKDEITWIPVVLEDGQTGYVSADFVKVESLYELAISAEELERKALEAEAARKAAEEEAARQAAAEEAARKAAETTTTQTSNNTSNSTSNTSNSDSDSYEGATTTPVTATESGECIGTFTITAYCGCKKCSGGNKKTASGTTPTEGRTIAADTSILPFGTKVVIGGVVYTVEDRGSGVSGKHIDIFFATHAKAIAFGRKSMKVYKY